MTGRNPTDIIAFALAEGGRQRLGEYLARGRSLAGVGLDDLQGLLRAAFSEWARSPFSDDAMNMAGDIISEYELRGIEAPMDAVAVDVRRLTSVASQRVERMDEAERSDFEATLRENFHKENRRPH